MLTQHQIDTWAKKGADAYHSDERPLFALDRKGRVYATTDAQMPRSVEDDLQEIGEVYLKAYQHEAARFSQRIA